MVLLGFLRKIDKFFENHVQSFQKLVLIMNSNHVRLSPVISRLNKIRNKNKQINGFSLLQRFLTKECCQQCINFEVKNHKMQCKWSAFGSSSYFHFEQVFFLQNHLKKFWNSILVSFTVFLLSFFAELNLIEMCVKSSIIFQL